MKQASNPTFAELREAARRSEWEYVDANLTARTISVTDFIWAEKEGVVDADKEVRDFAATVLIVGKIAIDIGSQSRLEDLMFKDPSHIVRYRLAIALYKQGNRNLRVMKMMDEARKDPDVGSLAASVMK